MKMLFCLLLVATLCRAQSTTPFKDANIFVIKTGLSDAEVFETMCKKLVGLGYPLEAVNKDYYQVKTGPKTSIHGGQYLLIINVDQGVIRIRPQVHAGHNHFYDWRHRKSNTAADDVVHETMLAHFRDLGEIQYDKD
jgi:hypothetical protein